LPPPPVLVGQYPVEFVAGGGVQIPHPIESSLPRLQRPVRAGDEVTEDMRARGLEEGTAVGEELLAIGDVADDFERAGEDSGENNTDRSVYQMRKREELHTLRLGHQFQGGITGNIGGIRRTLDHGGRVLRSANHHADQAPIIPSKAFSSMS